VNHRDELIAKVKKKSTLLNTEKSVFLIYAFAKAQIFNPNLMF